MNCPEFEKRLHEQFGPARLDETAELSEHARWCPACRATLEQFHLLADALGAWRAQVPEVELTSAVVSARQSDFDAADAANDAVVVPLAANARSAPRPGSEITAGVVARPPWPAGPFDGKLVRRLAAGGVAALFLVAVWLILPRHDAPPSISGPQLVGARDNTRVPSAIDRGHGSPAPRPVDPPPAVPEPAEAAYYDLAQKAAGALGEVTVFVMPGASRSPMSPSDSLAERTGGWIDGLEHQLKPIGRSLDHAFDFLWEAGQSADSSKT
ncbi:MAG: hypothetical protein ACM3U2_20865 [Deltaproteobacteria bacterium]